MAKICYNVLRIKTNTVRRGMPRQSGETFSLGDKEIAVKFRGNSHYRNLRGGALSRNAYRSVARGRLLGEWRVILRCPLKLRKDIKMKAQLKILSVISLILLAVIVFVACDSGVPATGKWENAAYRKDAEFGEGAKTVVVKVVVEENEVSFTLRTDEVYLGDALLEHGLIEGEEGEFGIYIKKVNGILADYDIDRTYWGFYKSGEMMMTGVSFAEISDGEQYELVLES